MIKIEGLNKFYNKGKENEIHVINEVSLELPSTGLISFLGPSGSGKTTLLNVIGGLDKAKGSITYDDLAMQNYNMHQIDKFRSKEIGYVFQNYNLLLEETVYSNLEIALEMIGVYNKEEQAKRIEYTLKAVGMYKYRKKRAYALSGGQQQRVSIARALVKQAKIIIADEPTGNLDSENTIEVMNILKKISQKSLVLVVTHNEEVANFYSDQVVRIQDGCIQERYQTDGKQSLNTEQSNTIYLKDLNLQEEQGELVSLKYYSTQEAKPLELRIIERNGTYYISSSEKLKLIEETNMKIIDSHYQALEQRSLEEFNYDTSWYQEDQRKENVFKRLWHSIQISFNKMRFGKRRAKFLYFAFFMIGVVLAICVIGFSNYYIIDTTSLQIDKNFNVLTANEYSSSDEIYDAYYKVKDHVENITAVTNFSFSFYKKINYSETINYSSYTTMISYKGSENLKLLAGKAPSKNEIVISRKIADSFLKALSEYYSTYESLIGIEVEDRGGYRVSGIVDNSYELIYMEDETFMNYITNYYPMDMTLRYYETEQKYDTYTILEGRDLTEEDAQTEYALITKEFASYLGKTYIFRGTSYEIVGVFDFNDYPAGYESCIITTQPISVKENNYLTTCYEYADYKIVEGKEPVTDEECIVPIYSSYEVGDIIYGGSFYHQVKVVGKYISNMETLGYPVLFSRNMIMLNSRPFSWFQCDNLESLSLEGNIFAKNVYDYHYDILREEQISFLLVFGILSLVLVITISIFIYFIMRSRMISDIYPIGVYRSIGASRFKLILRFVSDILVIVTLTSLLGYLLTTIIFETIAANVNSSLSVNALKSSFLFNFLGGLFLYILNLIFGLIPILMLMRKTPAEIISKYDI